MPFEPGGGQLGYQLLLLGGVDQLLRGEHDPEAPVPRHGLHSRRALQRITAQRIDAALAVFALADPPQSRRAHDGRGQYRDQNGAAQRVELGLADPEGEPPAERVEPGRWIEACEHG
jgi:hypothetical protein